MNIITEFDPGEKVRFDTGRGTKKGIINSIEITISKVNYLVDTGNIVYIKQADEIQKIN